ncbi:hypothetical protein JVT61DRAFT_12220 [Boletus reticuloceps]|uniref:Uncharacterized protein n=1 Tax=Boletus reticuloceps TaxID=495285 RepID=A0A8I2YE28_9AGAM|nr:hypothetical protein JVT61DRAFT_12220 [Boletus reticuloceps]
MNISVMSGNHMAYPLLISLANIDAHICSKTSLHAYLLVALLPIAKFTHKTTRVHSLLQDWLVHEALNIVLAPLKTATQIGIMMSDPVGNLRYCFTPIAAWITDTPEESLLSGTGPKVSLVTIASSKQFGNAHQHELCTADHTLAAIHTACSQYSPNDHIGFLKAAKWLGLNGVIDLVWTGWPLSQPCYFITLEVLHHFFRFAWNHDIQ